MSAVRGGRGSPARSVAREAGHVEGRCCFVRASKPYPKLKPLVWVSAQEGWKWTVYGANVARCLSSGARESFHAVLHSLLPATISRTKLGVATISRKKLSGKSHHLAKTSHHLAKKRAWNKLEYHRL